ncbi:MAG: flagellar motor protein MotB [Alphaproteobacteria bacterium]|nr:flagellar motor protein MotB [Alphaproteobacteria bacterium]
MLTPEEEPEQALDESWMTTYGDMVTLLMCFFVMLAGISDVDVVLFEQVQAGLAKGIGDLDVLKPIEMMTKDLESDIQNLEVGESVALGVDTQGIVMEFASASFYEPGSAVIREEAAPILKRIAGTLRASRYSNFIFKVEGHTDDAPIHTEQYPSNWELSAARASAVVRLLIERDIEKTRLQAIGMADIMPKVPNRDAYGEPIPENQEINRRVTVHIEPRRR